LATKKTPEKKNPLVEVQKTWLNGRIHPGTVKNGKFLNSVLIKNPRGGRWGREIIIPVV